MLRRELNKSICTVPLLAIDNLESKFYPSKNKDIYHLQYLFLTYMLPYGKEIYKSSKISFDRCLRDNNSILWCDSVTNMPLANSQNNRYDMCFALLHDTRSNIGRYIDEFDYMTKHNWYCPRNNQLQVKEIEAVWIRHYPGYLLSQYKHIKEFQKRAATIRQIEEYYNLDHTPWKV